MSIWLLYAKNRRLWLILAVIVACVIATPFIGDRYTPFAQDRVSGQLWAYSAIPAALMISGAASSAMSTLESHATESFHRWNALALVLLSAFGVVLFCGLAFAHPDYAQALITGRNLLFWVGMGLMAERIGGDKFAFVPIVFWFIVLQVFAEPNGPDHPPAWWAIPLKYRDDPWSWLASLIVLAIGVAVVYFKPQRRHGD